MTAYSSARLSATRSLDIDAAAPLQYGLRHTAKITDKVILDTADVRFDRPRPPYPLHWRPRIFGAAIMIAGRSA